MEDKLVWLKWLFLNTFCALDPNYLLDCLEYYHEDPVERISDKMLSFNGYYPKRPKESEPGSVHVKNEYLRFLSTELFPDCHVTILRECLLKQKHSHIEAVCHSIFQRPQLPVRLQPGVIEGHELITSERYKAHALAQLTHDYPNVRLSLPLLFYSARSCRNALTELLSN
jgi:hypothetical protein